MTEVGDETRRVESLEREKAGFRDLIRQDRKAFADKTFNISETYATQLAETMNKINELVVYLKKLTNEEQALPGLKEKGYRDGEIKGRRTRLADQRRQALNKKADLERTQAELADTIKEETEKRDKLEQQIKAREAHLARIESQLAAVKAQEPEPGLRNALLVKLMRVAQEHPDDEVSTNAALNNLINAPIAKVQAVSFAKSETGLRAEQIKEDLEAAPKVHLLDAGTSSKAGEMLDEGITLGEPRAPTAFQQRRSQLMNRVTKGQEAGQLWRLDNAALNIVDEINAWRDRFEFIRTSADGARMVNAAASLKQAADELMPVFTTRLGDLANSISAAQDDKALEEYKKEVDGLGQHFDSYLEMLNSVVKTVSDLIISEAWESAIQKGTGSGAVTWFCIGLSMIPGLVKKAVPPATGVAAAASSMQASIAGMEVCMQKFLRNRTIMEMMDKDPGFPIAKLNEETFLVAERVADQQKANLKVIFNLLDIPISEIPTSTLIWTTIRQVIEGGIDAYYSARVDKLKVHLKERESKLSSTETAARTEEDAEALGEVKEVVEDFLKEDVKEKLIEACQKAVVENAGEIANKIMEFIDAPETWKKFLDAMKGQAADAVKGIVEEFTRNALMAFVIRIGQYVLSNLNISTAQSVSGNDFLRMLGSIDYFRNMVKLDAGKGPYET